MDVQAYPDPPPMFSTFELDPNNIPPEFQDNMMAFGYWVINGALTNIPPPPPLPDLADLRRAAVRAARESTISAGVPLPGNQVFAPDAAALLRLGVVAVNHTAYSITAVEVEMGTPPVWYNIAAADLESAYAAYVVKREACYANERAHLEAIQLLLDQQDRPGLENYDTATGWPL